MGSKYVKKKVAETAQNEFVITTQIANPEEYEFKVTLDCGTADGGVDVMVSRSDDPGDQWFAAGIRPGDDGKLRLVLYSSIEDPGIATDDEGRIEVIDE